MFNGELGLHIIKFPSGRYGYVGNIPVVLGEKVKADISDIMGCRSFTDTDGEEIVYKFPSFENPADAVSHARSKNVNLCTAEGCSCRKIF